MIDTAPFRSNAAREAFLLRQLERGRAWPEPWTERRVSTAWGETYVRESGKKDGPPLVLLPGVGSPSHSLHALARDLGVHFHLYAVDNIYDVGCSVAAKPVHDADDFASWLDGLFDALGLARPHVLGLSYGGWVFSQYALRRPDRVGKVVLLAPAGTVAPINFAFIWRALLTLVTGNWGMRVFAAWAAPTMSKDPKWATAFAELVDDARLSQRSFARRRLVPPIPAADAEWAKLTAPTLLLFGDREVIFDPKLAAEKMARVAPQVKVEVIPGASHDLFVVAAGEVCRRAIAFLMAP